MQFLREQFDARLLPAMTATVNIIVEQQDDVILIPTSAISYARSQTGTAVTRNASPTPSGQTTGASGTAATVLVLRDGQAVPTRIQIGSSDDQNTVVLNGLSVGDRVITGQSVAAPTSSGSSLFGPSPKPGGGGGGQAKPGGGGGPPGGGG